MTTANKQRRPSLGRTRQAPAAAPAPAQNAPPDPAKDAILMALPQPALAKLKKGYSQSTFFNLAHAMFPYAKVAAFADLTGANIYNEVTAKTEAAAPPFARSTLLPAEREMVILTTLALTQRDPLTMSAHIYWALMEKLSVEKLADMFLTVGFYAGIDNLRLTSTLLFNVLTLLNIFAGQGKTETRQVLRLLKASFGDDPVAKGSAALAAPARGGNA
jgi:alkylhydroperoxidase/carboxymuconolactone decarboxylase family protein YurZ